MDKDLAAIAVFGVLALAGFVFYTSSSSGAYSLQAGQAAQNAGQAQLSGQLREISIDATNWAFSPSRITVNKGDRIKLTLRNVEGIHGITIPEFGVSVIAGAGESKSIEFTADKEGTFSFRCSVFCGQGHSEMTGQLIVQAAGAAQPTAVALNFQDIEIRGNAGGFEPKTIKVKAGEPVKLSFTADANAGCARTLRIKKAGISLLSRAGSTETAEFTPEKGVYEYTCSMAMFRGRIEAD